MNERQNTATYYDIMLHRKSVMLLLKKGMV